MKKSDSILRRDRSWSSRFTFFFRRPAEDSRERNIIFEAPELIELATEIWDEQYGEQEITSAVQEATG